MPFFDDGRYHLFYLKDRRNHGSKWNLGAHQFGHISSDDLRTWSVHPLVVEITHPWEGSICTGSILKAFHKYYAFYAVRMADGSSAKISWSVSENCIDFVKSEIYFTLQFPYETVSARDPLVFEDGDGLFHMLVTTSYLKSDVPGLSGCLVHLTSNDLQTWDQQEPFLIPGYTDQPECPDYFKWNDWYYLIFSNYGFAKYRYSKSPFGPWTKPVNDVLEGPLYRVPKTAEFPDNRRISAGFLSWDSEGDGYAGNVVFRELLQKSDGTLSMSFVPEMLSEISFSSPEIRLISNAVQMYKKTVITQLSNICRMKALVNPENPNVTYGFTLLREDHISYVIRFEPFLQRMTIHTNRSNPYRPISILNHIDGLEKDVFIDLIIHNNIVDISINKSATFVFRLPDDNAASNLKLGCFTKDGTTSFQFLNDE